MSRRPRLPMRRLEPMVDIHGRITHWKCSQCFWTSKLHPESTDMAPSPVTMHLFYKHYCEDHARSQTG
jgi:NAD-dependent SIR2 family protein deacetylase